LEKQFGTSSKSEMQLPYDPVIPLLGIHLRGVKIFIHTKPYKPIFTAALFVTGKE